MRKILRRFYEKFHSLYLAISYELSKLSIPYYSKDLTIFEVSTHFKDVNQQWRYYHNYLWNLSPQWLRDHRKFFKQDNRGFGEDAFHAMWYLLLRELKPKTFLEIGVFRGQVLSLVKLISKNLNFECKVLGVSPFTPLADSVSKYGDYNYEKDVREFAKIFNCPLSEEELCKALSTDQEAFDRISKIKWDLAYIDGNHDYEFVKHDFDLVSKCLSQNGLVVMDDAALCTTYRPRPYSFAGHAGPSKVVQQALMNAWQIVAQAGHNLVLKRRSDFRPI